MPFESPPLVVFLTIFIFFSVQLSNGDSAISVFNYQDLYYFFALMGHRSRPS